MVEFSVVVPTHNRPELLVEALTSVAEQTVDAFECIVVDDGSATARDVMPADPRFRLIELATATGPAGARNAGIEAAQGDAVAFLDDDDLWSVDRLELARSALPHADIAVCGSRWLHEAGSAPDRVLRGDVRDTIMDSSTPNLGRTAVRRDVLVPFDESYLASQDLDWWIRQTKVATVWSVDGIGLMSRKHDGIRGLNGLNARIEASERLMADHADYFGAHRRATAYRRYRLGLMCRQAGDARAGRSQLVRSLAARPSARAMRALLRPS